MKRYIYLLRHGNPGQRNDPRRCLGRTNVPLTDYGKEQLRKVKDDICSFEWTRVYSSPMCRCIETAECIGIEREKMIIKEDLCEMAAGIWENLTFDQIKKEYPDLYEIRGKNLGTFAVDGAESFQDAGRRFTACLQEIRQETDENLLIIAHAGVIRAFLCHLTGKPYDEVMDFSISYGSITILEETGEGLTLKEAGLRSAELLDREEIHRIYEKCQTPDPVIAHMEKVAKTAICIMDQICEQEGFCKADRDLLEKAALLHDIRRTEKDHASKSADFLRKEGYKEVADLVSVHHSDRINEKESLELQEILFYADKIVQDEKVVPLEKRFAKSFEKCRGIPEAEAKHRRLYAKSIGIEKKIKNTLTRK